MNESWIMIVCEYTIVLAFVGLSHFKICLKCISYKIMKELSNKIAHRFNYLPSYL
jgi:hypothetical protein